MGKKDNDSIRDDYEKLILTVTKHIMLFGSYLSPSLTKESWGFKWCNPAGNMKEVYPNIFLVKVKGAFGAFKPEVNIYVLAGPDGLMYDAGYGTRKSVKCIVGEIKIIKELYAKRGMECRITRIMPSHAHPDHFSGLKSLRRITGARIVLTRRMADIIKSRKDYIDRHHHDSRGDLFHVKNIAGRIIDKFTRRILWIFFALTYGIAFISDPDEIIDETSKISINGETWRIFPSPGHSSNHIALYNPEKGILFSGDTVLRSKTPWLGPPDSNLDDYMKSLEYIASLENLKIIFSAHGSPVENPNKRARAIAEACRSRTRQVHELIRKSGEKGLTIEETIGMLYRKGGRMKRAMARGWVSLTLKQLESRELVRRIEKGKGIFLSP